MDVTIVDNEINRQEMYSAMDAHAEKCGIMEDKMK